MAQTEELSFEQALERLEEIIDKLDAGDLPLEESIKLFEEGVALKELCQERLEKAEAVVEQYVTDSAAEGNAGDASLFDEED